MGDFCGTFLWKIMENRAGKILGECGKVVGQEWSHFGINFYPAREDMVIFVG